MTRAHAADRDAHAGCASVASRGRMPGLAMMEMELGSMTEWSNVPGRKPGGWFNQPARRFESCSTRHFFLFHAADRASKPRPRRRLEQARHAHPVRPGASGTSMCRKSKSKSKNL